MTRSLLRHLRRRVFSRDQARWMSRLFARRGTRAWSVRDERALARLVERWTEARLLEARASRLAHEAAKRKRRERVAA